MTTTAPRRYQYLPWLPILAGLVVLAQFLFAVIADLFIPGVTRLNRYVDYYLVMFTATMIVAVLATMRYLAVRLTYMRILYATSSSKRGRDFRVSVPEILFRVAELGSRGQSEGVRRLSKIMVQALSPVEVLFQLFELDSDLSSLLLVPASLRRAEHEIALARSAHPP
jgi:hypothetical protein